MDDAEKAIPCDCVFPYGLLPPAQGEGKARTSFRQGSSSTTTQGGAELLCSRGEGTRGRVLGPLLGEGV